MTSKRALRYGLGVALCALWIGFWLWAFSFAYSASFFRYNLCSRLPPLLAALFAVAVFPASAIAQWRSRRGAFVALALHALTAGASLVPLAAASFVLARVSGPCHLSGDDAMGVGINFMVLIAVAIVSAAGLLLGLVVGRRRRAQRAAAAR